MPRANRCTASMYTMGVECVDGLGMASSSLNWYVFKFALSRSKQPSHHLIHYPLSSPTYSPSTPYTPLSALPRDVYQTYPLTHLSPHHTHYRQHVIRLHRRRHFRLYLHAHRGRVYRDISLLQLRSSSGELLILLKQSPSNQCGHEAGHIVLDVDRHAIVPASPHLLERGSPCTFPRWRRCIPLAPQACRIRAGEHG